VHSRANNFSECLAQISQWSKLEPKSSAAIFGKRDIRGAWEKSFLAIFNCRLNLSKNMRLVQERKKEVHFNWLLPCQCHYRTRNLQSPSTRLWQQNGAWSLWDDTPLCKVWILKGQNQVYCGCHVFKSCVFVKCLIFPYLHTIRGGQDLCVKCVSCKFVSSQYSAGYSFFVTHLSVVWQNIFQMWIDLFLCL